MAEYIEREALKKKLGDLHFQNYGYALIAINEMPSADVVEVVRCKDCKHFTKGMAIGMCKRVEDKPIMPMPYNNYCGFGERRSE